MHFSRTIALQYPFILAVSLCILLSGCASKRRWSEPLQEEERLEMTKIISDMQETNKSCSDTLDAEARIFWNSPMGDSGVTGYLQIFSPSFIKFIVSNPLGMVVYAFASNGKSFQTLNTMERQHIRGSLHTLAIRRGLPLILAQGDWFALLGERLPAQPFKVLEVTRDTTDKTVWMLLSQIGTSKTSDTQWVHLNPTERKVLGYLFLDKEGQTLADISYEDQGGEKEGCFATKRTIHITDLPWGAEIRIELQDIRTDTQLNTSDFSLPVPVGYFKQLQP